MAGAGPVGVAAGGIALKHGLGGQPVGTVGVAFQEAPGHRGVGALEHTVLSADGDGVVGTDLGHFDFDHGGAVDQGLGDDYHAFFIVYVDVHAVPAVLTLVISQVVEVRKVLKNVEVCHFVARVAFGAALNGDGAAGAVGKQIVPGDHQVAGLADGNLAPAIVLHVLFFQDGAHFQDAFLVGPTDVAQGLHLGGDLLAVSLRRSGDRGLVVVVGCQALVVLLHLGLVGFQLLLLGAVVLFSLAVVLLGLLIVGLDLLVVSGGAALVAVQLRIVLFDGLVVAVDLVVVGGDLLVGFLIAQAFHVGLLGSFGRNGGDRGDFQVGLLDGLLVGFLDGLLGGLLVGFLFGLLDDLLFGLLDGLLFGLLVGFLFGLLDDFLVGFFVDFLFGLFSGILVVNLAALGFDGLCTLVVIGESGGGQNVQNHNHGQHGCKKLFHGKSSFSIVCSIYF